MCLFCNIVAGQIPADKVYEDDQFLAFNDIQPQAPIHILIIPKKHIATVNNISAEDGIVMGRLFLIAKQLAKKMEIDQYGYRLVMNCNEQGGQAVYHIHLHLLGGRVMSWPPG